MTATMKVPNLTTDIHKKQQNTLHLFFWSVKSVWHSWPWDSCGAWHRGCPHVVITWWKTSKSPDVPTAWPRLLPLWWYKVIGVSYLLKIPKRFCLFSNMVLKAAKEPCDNGNVRRSWLHEAKAFAQWKQKLVLTMEFLPRCECPQ